VPPEVGMQIIDAGIDDGRCGMPVPVRAFGKPRVFCHRSGQAEETARLLARLGVFRAGIGRMPPHAHSVRAGAADLLPPRRPRWPFNTRETRYTSRRADPLPICRSDAFSVCAVTRFNGCCALAAAAAVRTAVFWMDFACGRFSHRRRTRTVQSIRRGRANVRRRWRAQPSSLATLSRSSWTVDLG